MNLHQVESAVVDDLERLTREADAVAERRDAAIETAYRDGASLSQIANETGRTIEGIRRLLLRRDVPIRPRGRH